MTTYQQKPPQVEAEYWDGKNINQVQRTFPDAYQYEQDPETCVVPVTMPMPGTLMVPKLSYITKDLYGGISWMPKDAFEAQYRQATGP